MQKDKPFPYLAGYIDGDGSFVLNVSKRERRRKISPVKCTDYLCQISICGKQIKCLNFIKENFGGSIYKHKKIIENQAQLFLYRKNVPNDGFLKNILPFLIEKKDQCLTCMNFKEFEPCKRNQLVKLIKIQRGQNPAYENFPKEMNLLKNTIEPSETDYQYMSGFIDAECCICINKRKAHGKYLCFRPYIRCGNTKYPVIKWMMERFGGNVFFLEKGRYNLHSSILDLHISGKNLEEILKRTLPHLVHKSEQAKEVLRLIDISRKRKGSLAKDFYSWRDSILLLKNDIYHKVKALNQKGV